MTMLIRRLQNPPALFLLIISLLINPAVTLGYAWCVAADKHAFRQETVARDCSSDNYVANVTYRWDHSSSRQGQQPDSLLDIITPATACAHIPRPERDLNIHRVVDTPPRTSDHILHHRTIVLLI